MVGTALKRSIPILAVLMLTACTSMLTWQEQSAQTHIVKPGDTLFGIAWAYKLDHQDLAWWNGITDPSKLKLGQEIRLDGSGQVGKPRVRPSSKPAKAPILASSRNPGPSVKPAPVTKKPASVSKPASTSRPSSRPKPAVVAATSNTSWSWPYPRAVKRNYGAGRHGRDGLGFEVKLNEKVSAASEGKVVYVGNQYKQLGGLVVIHHANSVVSAYSFCGKMLVEMGQQVKAGQAIAHVGYNPKGEPAFNFGLRKDGKSLDVLAYLPKRN